MSMTSNNSFLGFESVLDFVSSLTQFKNWSLNVIPAMGASITTFITGYMWDDASAIYTLWALMGLDYASGVFKAMKNGELRSSRLFRMPLYFVATSFIIGVSWWMAKSSIYFYLLPSLVLGGFYAVYFTSLLENFGEIGLLPKTLVKQLENKFGVKAIIDKFTNTPPQEDK